MVNVRQPDGSIIQVPASFDPPSGNYFYKIGDKRYLADSSNPNVVGGFSKWESPTIIKARNREEAESQVNWAKNNLVRDASPIAAFIRNQSDMPDELKKELRNIDNPDLNKNAPGTIMNLMEAPAEEGNMLLHYIAKIDDPYDKQRATAMYNRLAQTYKDVKSADEQYRGFTNTGETGVKDTGDSSIFGLPTADYEWTKKRVIDIMAGGTSKDKTGLQEVIAGMVGKSPEDVGMDDWNELSTFDQVRIQKEIKKYTPK